MFSRLLTKFPLLKVWGVIFLAGISSETLVSETPEVDISFQVYLWRELTSIGDKEETGAPASSAPVMERQSVESDVDTPAGAATRAYRMPHIYYFADADAEPTRVNAAEGRLSRTYSYQGPNPLVFFHPRGESDQLSREIIGEVAIENGSGRFLLLFLPTAYRSGAYRILPLENSLDRVPTGSALIYNFTRGPLACRIGDQDFILAPGKYERIAIHRVENFTLPVYLAALNDQNEWHAIHRENVIVDPKSSLLFLIHRTQGYQDQLRILTLEN